MTSGEYLDVIKERLLTDPIVSAFHILRERVTLADGHLRARLTLSDDSLLEFSEYVQVSPDGQVNVVTYSYHWTEAEGNLIRRWDNTPHFPTLPDFPHHVHDRAEDNVHAGQPMSIFFVLDEIAQHLR
ncbi:MAG: DUF6516 family protein [Planctomycetota bacterium]